MSAPRPAVFLDRDGTIIEDVKYISRPEQVRLIAGAAAGIGTLNEAGIPVVVVSNQSGIGRGYFTYEDYQRVQARIEEVLGVNGAHVDATYICPHTPYDEPACACRKPKVELFRRAARDHGLDLAHSWYVGDLWRDVAPCDTLGGSGLLIRGHSTPPEDLELARSAGIVRESLRDVAREIIAALTAGDTRR